MIDEMSDDLPYRVEYAKSYRSKCRLCEQFISKLSLRLAVIDQNSMHDRKIPKWYHSTCFFEKQKPKSTADIACFDEIRNADQAFIQKRLEELSNASPSSGKGRKRTKGDVDSSSSDIRVEYAKSSRSTCKGCLEKIIKGEIRISNKNYESEEGRRFDGLVDRWHHVECFAKLRVDMGYYGSGDELPGAKELSKEDQKSLKASLPKMTQGDMPSPPKKFKDEPEDEKLMKKQNEELYAIKDQLSILQRKEMIALLERNHQEIPTGTSNILNLLSDIVYFGALRPCPKCKGQLIYNSGLGYKCAGKTTDWTGCDYITQDPKRIKCERDMHDFPIPSYKSTVKKRVFKVTASVEEKDEAVDPESGLEYSAHVYQKGKDMYTVKLCRTDVESKTYSYYKIQILKDNRHESYYLFRSSGQMIGSIWNGRKTTHRLSLEGCIELFESFYEKETGNQWKNRDHFVKMPNLMYPIDIDHGNQERN